MDFESTFLLEHPCKLSASDASLAADYNPLARPAAKADRVDVSAKGEVQTSLLLETPDADFVGTLHQQVMALGNAGDWTFETRVVWLDRQIDHRDTWGKS